jgi:hypothetical protein
VTRLFKRDFVHTTSRRRNVPPETRTHAALHAALVAFGPTLFHKVIKKISKQLLDPTNIIRMKVCRTFQSSQHNVNADFNARIQTPSKQRCLTLLAPRQTLAFKLSYYVALAPLSRPLRQIQMRTQRLCSLSPTDPWSGIL